MLVNVYISRMSAALKPALPSFWCHFDRGVVTALHSILADRPLAFGALVS